MQITNLHKRIALWVLSLVRTKTKSLVFGAILVAIVLAFVVPSATARAGAVVPILLGVVAAFGLAKYGSIHNKGFLKIRYSTNDFWLHFNSYSCRNLLAMDWIIIIDLRENIV